MRRFPAAALGAAAILAMTTSMAFAGAMGNGAAQRNGMGMGNGMYQWIKASFDQAKPGSVIVTLHLASATTSWRCDPTSGSVTQLPQPVENANPTSGIGVVVKKNPGSSAARVTADSSGRFMLPSGMSEGNYDIVITLPAHAVNPEVTGAASARVAASKGATITIPIAVGANGKIRRFNAELYVEKM